MTPPLFAGARSSFDVQGHRGARGLLPENTLPAFQKALELGVTTLEMDVVISKDHEVVVSHDPFMQSSICSWPDGRPVSEEESEQLRLYDMTYAEIAEFDCGMRQNPLFPRQQAIPASKPLLCDVIAMAESEVIKTNRKPVLYNIETKCRRAGDGSLHPKPDTFTRLLYSVLERAGVVERCTIQSFDERTLRAGRAINAEWRTSLLAGRITGRFVGLKVRKLGFTPTIYSPHYKVVTPGMVLRAHTRGMRVIPWTVNDEHAMLHLAEMGVDGLISDYPDLALSVLERFLIN